MAYLNILYVNLRWSVNNMPRVGLFLKQTISRLQKTFDDRHALQNIILTQYVCLVF